MKVKYLCLFKFYVVHTLCKRVVCIRLKCYLFVSSVHALNLITMVTLEFPNYWIDEMLQQNRLQRRIWGGARDAPPGVKILSFSCSFGPKNRLANPLWELIPPRNLLDPPLDWVYLHSTFTFYTGSVKLSVLSVRGRSTHRCWGIHSSQEERRRDTRRCVNQSSLLCPTMSWQIWLGRTNTFFLWRHSRFWKLKPVRDLISFKHDKFQEMLFSALISNFELR